MRKLFGMLALAAFVLGPTTAFAATKKKPVDPATTTASATAAPGEPAPAKAKTTKAKRKAKKDAETK